MHVIYVPTIGVNDTTVKLTGWYKQNGDRVKKNEFICDLESTKSSYEVDAAHEGFLYYVAQPDDVLKIGDALAIINESILENPEQEVGALFASLVKNTPVKDDNNTAGGEKKFTKKAAILAEKMGIDINTLEYDGTITEDVILKHSNGKQAETEKPASSLMRERRTADLVDDLYTVNSQERVLILGAGGGGNLVADILSRSSKQRACYFLDNNAQVHNKYMMGIKVLGNFSLITELWEEGAFDAVISTVVKDNSERQDIFNEFTSKGIPFTNVISESADIRSNVKMGTGNLIISGGYLAPCVTLGDNNFLAAGTFIEHHSVVGSHCTFGPRFTASGKVTIGNACKFGTGIFVEPFVQIGDKTTIASGAIITGHVPANSIVKTENKLIIKPKE